MSTRGRKAEPREIANGLGEAPPMPARIPEEMRPEWDSIVEDMIARKVLNEAMLPVVEAYVSAIYTLRMAQEAVYEEGVLVRGKDNLLKQNPAISLLGKSQIAVQRLSAELGLTPASRARSNQSTQETDYGNDGQFSLLDL